MKRWDAEPKAHYQIEYQPRRNGLAVGPIKYAYYYGRPKQWLEDHPDSVTLISSTRITEATYRMMLAGQEREANG